MASRLAMILAFFRKYGAKKRAETEFPPFAM
jgi:hypothetical protein